MCHQSTDKKKQLFYLNIGILLPKTSQGFTIGQVQKNEVCQETNRVWKRLQIVTIIHVQCLQLWYAHAKTTWKSNQARAPLQYQQFEVWKLQQHKSS